MKITKQSFVTLTLLIISASALANGGSYYSSDSQNLLQKQSESAFYIGASAGYADNHWDNYYDDLETKGSVAFVDYTNTVDTQRDTGFAGRVYMGFRFNRYAAIETGWTYLPTTKLVNHYTNKDPVFGNQALTTHAEIKNSVADVLVKLTWPIFKGLGLYTKFGGAYFRSKMRGSFVDLNQIKPKAIPATFSLDGSGEDTSNTHFGPAFGVGLQYQINQYVGVDVSWMHFNGGNKVPNSKSTKVMFQPNPDVVLAGVSLSLPTSYFSDKT